MEVNLCKSSGCVNNSVLQGVCGKICLHVGILTQPINRNSSSQTTIPSCKSSGILTHLTVSSIKRSILYLKILNKSY